MKKTVVRLLIIAVITIISVVIYGYCSDNVYAASTSYDIESIDDSKYPGFKSALEDVKSRHPNWKIKLYYTGLNWNDVIDAENTGHHESPKSLIYDTYSIGWRCPICGDEKFDVSGRYYCASKEAIEYMMDPRNSLDDAYIFQFQDLSSSAGDRESIEKMVEGTFLNKPSYIDAIMEAAQNESISPFHLVARIRQEQGTNGIGSMNGYPYRTESGEFVVVYNLFNINVSGNDTEAGLLAGAKYAYEQGWTTAEASILGGAKFLKEGYLDVGQSTLYFQKFDVIEQGGLYNHQYMQNIRAANDEGNSMYQSYRTSGILDGTFEFTIPLYENMPSTPASRPSDNYRGTINTQLLDINAIEGNGGEFISGNVYIAEWINNQCRTPMDLPKLTLKSTDGKVSKDVFVSHIDGIEYYFDVNIESLDLNKEYYIEAELTTEQNTSLEQDKTQRISLSDKILQEGYKGRTIKIVNNKIIFSEGPYEGNINTELLDLNIIQNSAGDNYISGNIYIAEWVGINCNTPKGMPEVWIKSTDGTVNEKAYVSYQDGIEYYFDKDIEEFDLSKQYYIEAKLVSEENIASEEARTQHVSVSDGTIGDFVGKNITVIAENNTLKLMYEGNINTQLLDINLIESNGDNYISGRIYIAEWIENECETPTTLPALYLKSTDGTVNLSMYVSYQSGIEYYFDKNIEGLDVNKEYYLEAQLTNENNTSQNKIQIVSIPNQEIGRNDPIVLEAKDNKIKITDSSLYYGTINTDLYEMNILQNASGDNYISGRIYIAEWVNGECRTPSTTPRMYLKSTDGTINLSMYVSYQNGIEYYFDKDIEGLDTSKEYYIEAELTNPKNQAEEESKKQRANITPQGEIGQCTNGNKVIVEDNIIKLVNEDTYYGTINTELHEINIIQNAAGDNYISGKINIAEWVNEECRTPSTTPNMYLKSTDGAVNLSMYVSYQNGIEYYFDKNIEGLDTSKEYYIEVELTNPKNQASEGEKKQTAKITPQGEIGQCTNENKVIVENNIIKLVNEDAYYGTINTELYEMNIIQNAAGDNYISGRIYIAEWVNGECRTPSATPKMYLKSTDGIVNLSMYVSYQNGIEYYFDKDIEGLDISKEYYIEVELTNPNNQAPEGEKKQTAKITQQGEIGLCTNGNRIIVEENNITINKNEPVVQDIQIEKERVKENEDSQEVTETTETEMQQDKLIDESNLENETESTKESTHENEEESDSDNNKEDDKVYDELLQDDNKTNINMTKNENQTENMKD